MKSFLDMTRINGERISVVLSSNGINIAIEAISLITAGELTILNPTRRVVRALSVTQGLSSGITM